jgi:hypothetical protein
MKIYGLGSVARLASDEKEGIFIVDRMLQAKILGHPRSRSSAKESYRYRARYSPWVSRLLLYSRVVS